MGKKHISTQVVLIFTSPVSFTLITGPLPIPSGGIGFRTPVILDTVGRAAWSLSWCKKTQEYGKNLRGRTSRSDWRDGASAAGLVTANLPFSIFDFSFFFFYQWNKGFSLPAPSHPPILPSCLRGRSWPPRRLQTDVLGRAEHALLDVTSSSGLVKEA